MRGLLGLLLAGALGAQAMAAPAAKSPVLKCSAIYLGRNGSAREAQKRELGRKLGAIAEFEDEFFSFHFESTAIGLYVGFQEKAPVRLIEIKANLAARNPYFDMVLPLSAPKKDARLPGGEIEQVEVECK